VGAGAEALAVQSLGEGNRQRALTDPVRATKEVGVANTLPLNSPTEQIDRLLVPDDAPA